MYAPVQAAVRNRLLATLAPEDFSLLQPQLEPVALPGRTRLIKPNTPIQHAYFLEQGIISVMATTPEGCRIEVGIIGSEGMTGTPILLGTDRAPHESFVQMPGTALRIRADDLRRAVSVSASLRQHLLRFAQIVTIQMGQTALANGCHRIGQRLARWLLMCHDRVDGDELFTTHMSLSKMLGVRRQSVTETLQSLEERGAISVKPGQITVLDRAKLETVAGDSYGVPEAEYTRLFGLPLRPFKHAALERCL
jgi:CRP-like cAMP-binding protein